ncbi:MAG: hypothetical protein R3F54_24855 [Alphaproteobacteria bacterium]
MADPAPSEDPAASSDKASAAACAPADSQAPGPSAFTHTRQHVADRQAGAGTIERFTNTKLNIALINDPKNGPRFTMTKRETGVGVPDAATGGGDEREARAASDKPEGRAAPPPQPAPHAENRAARPASEQSPPPAGGVAAAPAERATLGLLARPQAAPSGVPPAAEPPSKVPVDSSKTFVGHNGTYYDESWRWMDWRGTRQSWNWPAALTFGHWFAYRRLHLFAGLHLLWLAGLAAAAVNDIPLIVLPALLLLMVGLAGVYGNTLYFFAFRRAVDHVTQHGEGSYEERRGQLAAAGGTSVLSLCLMAVLSLAAVTGALTATLRLRDGFLVNLWPFL